MMNRVRSRAGIFYLLFLLILFRIFFFEKWLSDLLYPLYFKLPLSLLKLFLEKILPFLKLFIYSVPFEILSIGLCLALIYLLSRKDASTTQTLKRFPDYLYLRAVPIRWCLCAGLVGFCVPLLYFKFNMAWYTLAEGKSPSSYSSVFHHSLLYFVAALPYYMVGSFLEEISFRSILFRTHERFPSGIVVLISVITFVSIHPLGHTSLSSALAGTVACFLLRTGSVIPSIIPHMSHNICNLLVISLPWSVNAYVFTLGGLFVPALIIFVWGIFYFRKQSPVGDVLVS